ncbi:MAG: CoA transferase [Pseudomonadales bacterium]
MGAPTLQGIRVVDVGDRLATAWCSRLLADYGAEVIVVESEAGHLARRLPPFDTEGQSLTARYVLANKKSVGGEATEALVGIADVVVTGFSNGARLLEQNPNAIVCAITPYGQTGPLKEYQGNDLTAYARSGWAHCNGLLERPPLKGSGYQASYQAGTLAFGGVVAALIERLATGSSGQLIDISEWETLVSTSAPAPLRYQYSDFLWQRRRAPVNMNEGPIPVKDGYFALPLSRPAFWTKAMHVLGLPDLADDEDLQQPGIRPKHTERFAKRVAAAMSNWARMDLFGALAAERVIAGPVLTMDEMADNPQFQARRFLRTPSGSGVRFPGPFARTTKSVWELRHEMPKPRSSDVEFTPRRSIAVQPVRSGGEGKGPLSGFRGLVLTQAWAGAYTTQLLALLGADVVQVEVRSRLDSWRGSYLNPIPRKLADTDTARHAWNCSPLYNSVNLNKRCVTIDLSEPDGKDLFTELLPHFDFVAENFSPRVMNNLGVGYEALKAIKPDIVFASLSAYGATGPWAKVPGIGGTIEPSSGMSSLLGYDGEQPQNSGQMYPDPVAGLCGFAAIALALLHRDRSGEGQYIDLSMQEANFSFIGDAWMEYEINGHVRGPRGNRHALYAPHAIYPSAGSDKWVAIAAETDVHWKVICEVLEIDGRQWNSNQERKQHEESIDALILSATKKYDRDTLAEELGCRGVPAAPVLSPADIVADTQLRDRGHMVQVIHPEAGAMWQSGLPMLLSRTQGGVTRPAPLQGQHSFEVFEEFLGMPRQRYDELAERGITGKGEITR